MSFRIAACQMNSQNDKAANLKTADRLIDEAAELGADLVALPEVFNCIGLPPNGERSAEPIPGPTSEFLRNKAIAHGIYVHGGSIPEAVPDSEKSWNTTLVYDPQGVLVARYRKVHLFDIDIPGKASFKESDRFEAGEEMVTFESEHGNFGLSICYDIRFPEFYRALTLAGARLVFLPSAFTLYTGKDHWETLIRARAIENQIYMVAPAQIGAHSSKRQSFGSTMIVDPWGTVLARAPERECVIFADIDGADQDRIRTSLPSLDHRRPDIYG